MANTKYFININLNEEGRDLYALYTLMKDNGKTLKLKEDFRPKVVELPAEQVLQISETQFEKLKVLVEEGEGLVDYMHNILSKAGRDFYGELPK